MIVVAAPRSGGTIYCIGLAQQLQVPFAGEISWRWVEGLSGDSKAKQQLHETGNQPVYSLPQYLEHVEDIAAGGSKAVYLINAQVELALPLADRFLLRRDAPAACMSLADVMLKAGSAVNEQALLQHIYSSIDELLRTHRLIAAFAQRHDRQIEYFEDLFTSKGEYATLNAHPLAKKVSFAIKNLLDSHEIGSN